MEILIIVIIILFVCVYLHADHKNRTEVYPEMIDYNNKLVDEGVELKKEAEKKLSKIKCDKGGNCNFIETTQDIEHYYGWGDEITQNYVCTKCDKETDEVVQSPN